MIMQMNIHHPQNNPPIILPCPAKVFSGFGGLRLTKRCGWQLSHLLRAIFRNPIQRGNVSHVMRSAKRFRMQGMVFPHWSQYKPNQLKKALLFIAAHLKPGCRWWQCGQGMTVLATKLGLPVLRCEKLIAGTRWPRNKSLIMIMGFNIQSSLSGYFQVLSLYLLSSKIKGMFAGSCSILLMSESLLKNKIFLNTFPFSLFILAK